MFFNKGKKKIVSIEGMKCEHCSLKVKDAISGVFGVDNVKVNLGKKEAIVRYLDNIDDNRIISVIEDLGYKVTSIRD